LLRQSIGTVGAAAPTTQRGLRAAVASGLLLAAFAAAWALYAAWAHAILHWYADAWRVYPMLIDLSWSQALLLPDNGHRPVLSQALRWLDLHGFGGDQRLLRVVGVAWLLATLSVLLRECARAADTPAWLRAQALPVLVLGIAWLGNARMLTHPYEAVHVYLVVLLLALAAGLVSRAGEVPLAKRQRVALVACGVLATFTFGPGIVLLAAAAVVLLLVRARPAEVVTAGLGLAVALVLYLGLPGADGVRGSLHWSPLVQFDLLLRWLATPLLFLGLPLADPAAARAIPFAPASALVVPLAEAWQRAFGDVWTGTLPQRLIGSLALAWLLQVSAAAWSGRRPQLAAFGLVLAWFAVGTGALIALTRSEYFGTLPRELHAARYLPWSSLFWSGLAAASLAQYGAACSPGRLAMRVGVPAVILLSSNFVGHAWSARVAALAAVQSVAARDGREPVHWGETVPTDFRAALESARRARVGPWHGVPALP
jgi:hypothetical protein